MVWENNDTPARLDASSAAASPQEWDEAEMPVLLLTRELEVENLKAMSKTVGKSSPQTGKWESKEFRASQGRKNHSAVNPAPAKGMEKTDQAERRSCLAER